jgi:hypothetical protein
MRKRVLVIGKSHTNLIPGESELQEERNGSTHQFIQFLKGNIKEIIVLRNKETNDIQLKSVNYPLNTIPFSCRGRI